jgi:hypothetical protein
MVGNEYCDVTQRQQIATLATGLHLRIVGLCRADRYVRQRYRDAFSKG